MSDDSKKAALAKIEEYTNQITELITKAQEIADKEGINFYVNLNGTGGTYYGENSSQPPNEDDFETVEAYDEAFDKWEEETGGDAHPWGDHGWVNSSFDC